ncbi:MAG: OmpA family protein [Acidobacteriota bacterium]|nr:OmpA family protein [Acidobacteriota bacterium]
MPRRTNPWPAFVDLFAALLIASFGGFIMLTGAYQQELKLTEEMQGELERIKGETTRLRQEAENISNQVRESLKRDSNLQIKVGQCGEDICIDLYIHFELNGDQIVSLDERQALENLCPMLKKALDELKSDSRQDIDIFIEGHTDSQQPFGATDPEQLYRHNWDLSARRATSVAYVFQGCSLGPPDYQIVAIGYADTRPVPGCDRVRPDCYDKNRRTTLRLRADTSRIESRLKQHLQPLTK